MSGGKERMPAANLHCEECRPNGAYMMNPPLIHYAAVSLHVNLSLLYNAIHHPTKTLSRDDDDLEDDGDDGDGEDDDGEDDGEEDG